MPPTRARAFCYYPTPPATPREHDAFDFVLACKNDRTGWTGYADVAWQDDVFRIRPSRPEPAWRIFGEWVFNRLCTPEYEGDDIWLVPVPGRNAVETGPVEMATRTLAEHARREQDGVFVLDVLRWDMPMPSSRAGGSRDPGYLLGHLRCTAPGAVAGRRIVVLDDVMTTGGHIRAAARLLRDHGATVDLALVAGRSSQSEDIEDAFRVPPELLDDDW